MGVDMGADAGADIFLSHPSQKLISPWRKSRDYLKKNVKIKKVDLFLHILPDSNQITLKTVKSLKVSMCMLCLLVLFTRLKITQPSNESHFVTSLTSQYNQGYYISPFLSKEFSII